MYVCVQLKLGWDCDDLSCSFWYRCGDVKQMPVECWILSSSGCVDWGRTTVKRGSLICNFMENYVSGVWVLCGCVVWPMVRSWFFKWWWHFLGVLVSSLVFVVSLFPFSFLFLSFPLNRCPTKHRMVHTMHLWRPINCLLIRSNLFFWSRPNAIRHKPNLHRGMYDIYLCISMCVCICI